MAVTWLLGGQTKQIKSNQDAKDPKNGLATAAGDVFEDNLRLTSSIFHYLSQTHLLPCGTMLAYVILM